MQSEEIRTRFLSFFEKRGHKAVSSSSLVTDDASVLFTTAGMQQFKPYYTGAKNAEEDFGTLNTVSIQKCVRTSDIDEVGDESHLTFFEMLGNFSFGGYFKEKAIQYAYEFITQEMSLKIDYVSIFGGEGNVPADEESEKIWKTVTPDIEVRRFGRADNFWGPTGEEGPCGPTTEIYVNGVEIWNIVFNEYYQSSDKSLEKLKTPGIDTGMGLERLAMVTQEVPTIFDTDLFIKLIGALPKEIDIRKKRILADHSRAISFIINEGVMPSNKDKGYILRRLLRRILAQFEMEQIKLAIDWVTAKYPELDQHKIREIIDEEWKQFIVALNLGVKELNKLNSLDSQAAFRLYSSYGLPFDVMKDKFPELNIENFEAEFNKHQKLSRTGAEQKFKGGLAGHSDMEIKYHTATHLLHQALHDVLGKEVMQKGSNITPERLRFDFVFPRKLTDEEKQKVEDMVNEKIKEALPVHKVIMPKAEAEKTGARHFFDQKYPDEVSIYYIGDTLENAYSKEFCGGPHVENIGTLGHFKITKEEAVSAGVRRIKAVLE